MEKKKIKNFLKKIKKIIIDKRDKIVKKIWECLANEETY